MCTPYELSRIDPELAERKIELLIEFWSSLYDDGDIGAANWEALCSLRDGVTMALGKHPPDICLAESLTARAMLLIEGLLSQ